MADIAKIQTLHDNTTGEAVAPRTVVSALSGDGTAGQLVGYTDDNVVGNITPDATPMEGNTNPVQSGGVYEATKWCSNQNLLDNPRWDKLEYIINQRCVGGKISQMGYFIDRWKLVSGSVTVAEGGLVLNGAMVQILERDPGSLVTASVLTTDGIGTAEYDADTKTFTVSGTGETLLAAKLEIGDRQTIAHKERDMWVLNDPPPNYGIELAKCRRYFQTSYANVFGGSYNWYGEIDLQAIEGGFFFTNGYFLFPVKMRSNPTITIYSPATGEQGACTYGGTEEIKVYVAVDSENGFGIYPTIENVPLKAGTSYWAHYTASADL